MVYPGFRILDLPVILPNHRQGFTQICPFVDSNVGWTSWRVGSGDKYGMISGDDQVDTGIQNGKWVSTETGAAFRREAVLLQAAVGLVGDRAFDETL